MSTTEIQQDQQQQQETIQFGPKTQLLIRFLKACFGVGVHALTWMYHTIRRYLTVPSSIPVTRESIIDREAMRQEDLAMIQTSRQIMTDQLGEKPIDAVMAMDDTQRMAIIEPMMAALVAAYGIPAPEVVIMREQSTTYGGYNRKLNQLTLNVEFLLSDNREDVKEFLDTIFHELRHAVQYHMVMNPDFWGATREYRAQIAYNMQNYILPSKNPKGYIEQFIERDAFTYAYLVMEGL